MEAPARMLCVLACADISPGDEIRIEYRDGPSALHPYVEPSESSASASASGTGEGETVAEEAVEEGAVGAVGAVEAVAAFEAGMEAARSLVMSYSTTDDFASLCVAHDRLLRTVTSDA